MISLLFTPLVVHFCLTLLAGAMLARVWHARAIITGAAVSASLSSWQIHAAAVLCVGLAVDAFARNLFLPLQIFPLLLLGLYVVLHGLTSPAVQNLTHSMTTLFASPRVRLATFVLALIGFLGALVLTPLAPEPEFQMAGDNIDLNEMIEQFKELPNPLLRTDCNRPVRALQHVHPNQTIDRSLRAFQKSYLASLGLQNQVITLGQAWHPCNCHGYVFAGGRYWIPGDMVETILHDNAYCPISEPGTGDLAIYRDGEGQITHTGLVRGLGTGTVLVESKWGKLGCFIHPHQAYLKAGMTCSFYRSDREGHQLHILPAPNAVGLVDQPASLTN